MIEVYADQGLSNREDEQEGAEVMGLRHLGRLGPKIGRGKSLLNPERVSSKFCSLGTLLASSFSWPASGGRCVWGGRPGHPKAPSMGG